MSLVFLIAIPMAGGLLAWALARRSAAAGRWTALVASLAGLGLAISLWVRHFGEGAASVAGSGGAGDAAGAAGGVVGVASSSGSFVAQLDVSWIPQAGIRFHLGADGLTLVMLTLTFMLVTLALLSSWKSVPGRAGLFHLNLLWAAAALAGVFLALDLFLFYFFFEMMLVPFYFLIAIWGHEKRRRAAIKFFLYTQVGGLLMLVSIVALYFLHGRQSGVYTFDYLQLIGTSLSPSTAVLLMLGFFAAFAVKLPAVPLHGWLPDAHSQASTAGSVMLAGLLIKVGAYGMLRFLFPLFPQASSDFSTVAMALGVVGILYGAVLAFAQTDLKRMVAYTSISHMGFVLLGIFAWNELALQGVVLQIVCHAFSTGGLFMMAGVLEERLGTRDLGSMGGLWAKMPRLGGFGMFLGMAALGLPGLGNFIAEFLILLGAYQTNRVLAIIAAIGLVTATVYALWLVQKVFHGRGPTAVEPSEEAGSPGDVVPARWALSVREVIMFGVTVAVILWIGLYPQTLVSTTRPAADFLLRSGEPVVTETAAPPAAAAARAEAPSAPVAATHSPVWAWAHDAPAPTAQAEPPTGAPSTGKGAP